MNAGRSAVWVRALALFAAASWCGAMGFFAMTAGTILRTSPSRHAGGAVNRALLDALDLSSFGAAVLILVAVLALDRLEPLSRVPRALALRLAVLAAAAAFASSFLITPQMMALRDRMPTIIDLVPKTDPLRVSWGRLHALSSLTLVVRIASAAGLFAALAAGSSAAGSRRSGRDAASARVGAGRSTAEEPPAAGR